MATASFRLHPVLILLFPQNRNILLRRTRRSRQKGRLHGPQHPPLHHGFPGNGRTLQFQNPVIGAARSSGCLLRLRHDGHRTSIDTEFRRIRLREPVHRAGIFRNVRPVKGAAHLRPHYYGLIKGAFRRWAERGVQGIKIAEHISVPIQTQPQRALGNHQPPAGARKPV